MAEEENIGSLCKKSQVGDSLELEELQRSEAEMGNQAEISQVGGIVPKDLSENIVIPSSPLTREEEKKNGLSEPGLFGSSIAPGESKGSEPEMINRMDVTCADIVVPENKPGTMALPSSLAAEEKVEGSFEKGLVSCLVVLEESKGSEADNGSEMVVPQVGRIVPECLLETVDPQSSSTIEEEKVECSSEKVLLGSSVVLEASKGSETGKGDLVNLSQLGGIMPKNNMGLPLSFVGMLEAKIESSSEKNEHESLVVEESKGFETESDDQVLVPQVGGTVPETTLGDTGPPSSSLAIVEEKINSLYEKNPQGICAVSEEPKQCETENGDQMVVSQLRGIVPEDTLGNMHLSSSSLAMEAEKIDDAPEKSPCGISVTLEESKGSRTENNDQMVASHVGGMGSEDGQVGGIEPDDACRMMDLSSSQNIPEESNRSLAETNDQT